jgi:hypothetical protein
LSEGETDLEENKMKKSWETPQMKNFGTLAEITGQIFINKKAGNSDVIVIAGMDPIPVPGSGCL